MATVLVVDDEPAIVELLVDIVTDAGHTPLTAYDGLQALDLAHVHRPTLIITDVMMPRMDGYALLDRLRADPDLVDTLVIVMSAAFNRHHYHYPQSTTVYLNKPFNIIVIEEILSNLS